MIDYKTICKFIGSLLLLESVALLGCVIMSICYNEPDQKAFIITFFIAILLGIFLRFIGRKSSGNIFRREAYFIVTVVWIIFSLIGMLPFLISGYCNSVSSAFFEAMSGFTTTGATALVNIDVLPHSLLFWRSLTHWIGGLGIVFFTLTLVPSNIQGGTMLLNAEATGLSHEKIHPRIRTTAKWLLSLYVFLTFSCGVCLWFFGMSPFDSVNFSMATLATGGFAPHSAGIMFYHSAAIEYVEIIFMFLAGTNFTILYLMFTKRSLGIVKNNEEFRFYLGTVLFISGICAIALIFYNHYAPLEAIRASLFNVVSLESTTGFVSNDFSMWYHPLWLLLLYIMFIGSCAGSTSGGLKCIRVVILVKTAIRQFKRQLHPNAVLPVRINHVPVNERTENILLSFFVWYVCLIFICTLLLNMLKIPLLDAASLSITCISNVGPAIGHMYTPLSNFATLPDLGKWICSFLMLAGRLEIFCVLLPMTRSFWKRD